MVKAYLGLGSNMGNKRENINRAVELLDTGENIIVTGLSSYYETEPVGYLDQDLFLNIVVEINTNLGPYELLDYCNNIEKELKRKRTITWGPRTIDIDILCYEGLSSREDKLSVPHPRMMERAFVMVPLYELTKDIIIDGMAIRDIMQDLDTQGIRKLSE